METIAEKVLLLSTPAWKEILLAEEDGNFSEAEAAGKGLGFRLKKGFLPGGYFIRCTGEKNVVLSFG